MTKKWIIYGANGYTGRLICAKAKSLNLAPVIAGRDSEKLKKLSKELDFPFLIFSLHNSSILTKTLKEFDLILNCAGPFSKTAQPLIQACIEAKTHYLDITGEIDVFGSLMAMDDLFIKKNILVMPGVGFDVVPTDCLALQLKEKLPDASTLELVIHTHARPSIGTLKTMVESASRGSIIRKNSKLTQLDHDLVKEFTIQGKKQTALALPWGDIQTAYFTTHIPNISVYFTLSKKTKSSRSLKYLKKILRFSLAQKLLQTLLNYVYRSPSPEEIDHTNTIILGIVRNDQNEVKMKEIEVSNGYQFTADSSVKIVSKLLEEPIRPGFHTPAEYFGSGLLEEI